MKRKISHRRDLIAEMWCDGVDENRDHSCSTSRSREEEEMAMSWRPHPMRKIGMDLLAAVTR